MPLLLAAGLLLYPTPASAASYDAAFAGESAFLELEPGGTGTFAAFFLNTGTTTWVAGTATQVDLAACRDDKVTCDAQDPTEAPFNDRWLSATRYARQTQGAVAPGQIATFSYGVKVDADQPVGTYVFNGALVVAATGADVHNEGYFHQLRVLPPALAPSPGGGSTTDFMPEACGGFSSTGRNPFFVLEPGYQLVLRGTVDREDVELTITVRDETKVVDGASTRVVEERETHDGTLVEVSRNYFAICDRTNSVFYFGEDTDIFEDGSVTHEGSWLSGRDGAKAGVAMPGVILLGSRYFQEVAPGVAMDRAEIVSMTEVVETPAGTFEGCVRTFETTPLEPGAEEFKVYARGVGLIQDDELKLVRYGMAP